MQDRRIRIRNRVVEMQLSRVSGSLLLHHAQHGRVPRRIKERNPPVADRVQDVLIMPLQNLLLLQQLIRKLHEIKLPQLLQVQNEDTVIDVMLLGDPQHLSAVVPSFLVSYCDDAGDQVIRKLRLKQRQEAGPSDQVTVEVQYFVIPGQKLRNQQPVIRLLRHMS